MKVDICLQAVLPYVSKFQRHWEEKYRRKCSARNARSARQVLMKFWTLPEWQQCELAPQDVLGFCDAIGLQVEPGYNKDMMVTYPKAQASAGLFYHVQGRTWYRGPKETIWDAAYRQGRHILDEIEALGLKWSLAEDMDEAQRVALALARRFHWVLVPAFRLDGGYNKIRRLLIGTADMYVVESIVFANLHEAMVANESFGYRKPEKVAGYFAEARAGKLPLISGDMIGYDEHQSPQFLASVYRAAGELCALPESVVVALWLYNTFAPTVVCTPDAQVVLLLRNGQAASGIGAFSFMNSLGCGALNFANWKRTLMKLGIQPRPFVPGLYMGDDQVQPCVVGVDTWRSSMLTGYGFPMDEADTMVSDVYAKFARRIFQRGTNVARPIFMSRCRNVLFPERSDLESLHPWLRALMQRSAAQEVTAVYPDDVIEAWTLVAPLEAGLYSEFPVGDSIGKMYSRMLRRSGQNTPLRRALEAWYSLQRLDWGV